MTISVGTRLGPYEILSPLGAGGMGEVYRARDARLDRTVAIKVLPAELSSDPDRLRRLEQEARLASGLEPPEHRDGLRHRAGRLSVLHRARTCRRASPSADLLRNRERPLQGQTLRKILAAGPLPRAGEHEFDFCATCSTIGCS
jgi:serine/threonine protein kinase